MSQEKMLLNDVVYKISDIDNIPDQEGYNEINLTITIPYYLAKKLSVSYRENPIIIKKIIEDHLDKIELQHHTTSLFFEGKPPRKDMLLKLLAISEEASTYPDLVNLKRWHVEKIIKTALNKPDERTTKKYLVCIQNYVKGITGREVYYNANYNLFELKTAVLELLKEVEGKKEINNVNS